MPDQTTTITAHAMPLQTGGFVPYVRSVRTCGTLAHCQAMRAGHPCATEGGALAVAQRQVACLMRGQAAGHRGG